MLRSVVDTVSWVTARASSCMATLGTDVCKQLSAAHLAAHFALITQRLPGPAAPGCPTTSRCRSAFPTHSRLVRLPHTGPVCVPGTRRDQPLQRVFNPQHSASVPPWQGLFAFLEGDVTNQLRRVYPVRPERADEWLGGEIARAARDPGALGVFRCAALLVMAAFGLTTVWASRHVQRFGGARVNRAGR